VIRVRLRRQTLLGFRLISELLSVSDSDIRCEGYGRDRHTLFCFLIMGSCKLASASKNDDDGMVRIGGCVWVEMHDAQGTWDERRRENVRDTHVGITRLGNINRHKADQ
jgi:hypothetical protein